MPKEYLITLSAHELPCDNCRMLPPYLTTFDRGSAYYETFNETTD